MTDIKVIKREEIDVKKLSREEREEQLRETAKRTGIANHHLENLLHLGNLSLQSEARSVRPEILSLLIRSICRYRHILPIVTLPSRLHNIDDIREYYGVEVQTFGTGHHPVIAGKESTIRRKITTALNVEKKKDDDLITQFAEDKSVLDVRDLPRASRMTDVSKLKKMLYRIPRNDSVLVHGLVIIPEFQRIKYYEDNFTWMPSVFHRMIQGPYSEKMLYDKLFGPYRDVQHGLTAANLANLDILNKDESLTKDSPSIIIVKFENSNNARDICNLLFTYNLNLNHYEYFDRYNRFINSANDYHESPEKFNVEVNQLSEPFKYLVELLNIFPKESTCLNVSEKEETVWNKIPKAGRGFLEELQKITLRKFSAKWESSITFDLLQEQFLSTYEKFMYDAAPAKIRKELNMEIEAAIAARKLQVEQNTNHAMKMRMKIDAEHMEMTYRWIYIEKFGYDRFVKIMNGNPYNPESILTLVSPREKSLILTQQEKTKKYLEAWANNTCPHIPLERKMRESDDRNTKIVLYKNLRNFMPTMDRRLSKEKLTSVDFIKCNNCKFDLICPHVRDQMELLKKRVPDHEITNFIVKYAGKTPFYQYYYCKICGEEITKTLTMDGFDAFIGGKRIEFHNIEDDLRNFIWGAARYIVSNYIEFSGVQTEKFKTSFVAGLVDTIYDFIVVIDKSIGRSKTISAEEMANKKQIFTEVYIFALLIKVIKDNPKSLKFTYRNRFKYEKSGKTTPINKLFSQAYTILADTKNVLISKTDGVDENVIKNSLFKAYSNVTSVLGKSHVQKLPSENFIDMLMLDPVYSYYVLMRLLSTGLSNKSADAEKEWAQMIRTQKSLGQTPAELMAADHIFEKAKNPVTNIVAQRGKNLFKELLHMIFPSHVEDEKHSIVARGKDYTENLLSKEKNIKPDMLIPILDSFNKKHVLNNPEGLARLYGDYYLASFELFWDYVKDQTYLYHIYQVSGVVDEKNENLYYSTKRYTREFLEYFTRVEQFIFVERIILDLLKDLMARIFWGYERMAPYISTPNFSRLSRKYGLPAAKPGKSIFHIHKWDIYVYAPVGSKSLNGKKMTGDEYNALSLEKKKSLYVVDRICTICHYARSNIEKIISDPVTLINEEMRVENFYNYYAFKCPDPSPSQLKKGDPYHIFNEGAELLKCKNCGYIGEFRETHDRAYYRKYSKKFDKTVGKKKILPPELRSLKPSLGIISTKATHAENEQFEKDLKASTSNFVKWKFNPTIITQFVNTTHGLINKGVHTKGATVKGIKLKKPAYFNIIANIGLSEGLAFDEIKKGKISPFKEIKTNERMARTRIISVGAIIQELRVDYSIIQNYRNMTELPAVLGDIIKAHSTGLSKIKTFPNLFIDYDKSLNKMIRAHYVSGDYHKVSNFKLDALLKILLSILKINNKIMSDFIVYFINKLIDGMKAVSKVEAKKETELNAQPMIYDNVNDNEIDNRAARTFDDLVDEGARDNFAYEEMDYGGENEDINT